MKYVLLLHLSPGEAGDPARYAELKAELQAEGVWLGGQALQPPAITTQVRVRDDETLLVDGPLVETGEQIAGYYLIDCRDHDEAVSIAARIPGARFGVVEVRPVHDYEAEL